MKKIAICVKSCHADLDRGCHDAIRSTWARDLRASGIETYFFMGADAKMSETRQLRRLVSGEVVLDCKDDYMSLPMKTKRICQWAQGKTFSHIFLCDTDTYVFPGPFICGYAEVFRTEADYAGYFLGREPGGPPFTYTDAQGTFGETYPWASGGWGYFLSRNALTEVAAFFPKVWAEDLWVGQILGPPISVTKRMKGLNIAQNTITEHFPKSPDAKISYKPEYMSMAHQNGGFRALFHKKVLYMV
jgi:hypothetical protein